VSTRSLVAEMLFIFMRVFRHWYWLLSRFGLSFRSLVIMTIRVTPFSIYSLESFRELRWLQNFKVYPNLEYTSRKILCSISSYYNPQRLPGKPLEPPPAVLKIISRHAFKTPSDSSKCRRISAPTNIRSLEACAG
jgi:hypothetical protein